MEFLTWLQDQSIAIWVAESESLWAYPTVLALHTLGLSVLVGANVVIDFRFLGLSPTTPVAAFRSLFGLMWGAFLVNALTGVLLFMAQARIKGVSVVFYIKLAFIALAIVVLVRIRRVVFGAVAAPEAPLPASAKTLGALSLVLWTGATVAGRLMAYVKWNLGE